jgi:hypothetical protein
MDEAGDRDATKRNYHCNRGIHKELPMIGWMDLQSMLASACDEESSTSPIPTAGLFVLGVLKS